VRSQIKNYRAKAKKFARLSAVAKSLRHSRQCRKLADMYWALALGEEPERGGFKNKRSEARRMAMQLNGEATLETSGGGYGELENPE